MNKDDLQKEICRQLCADIQLVKRENGRLMISTPFSYPDGDHYSIYVEETIHGTVRLSDEANTMMRLSYDTPDVNKYFKGNRGDLTKQILRENKVEEDNGNFYVDISVSKIADGIFRLGQALSQVYDLSYLSRDRLVSTFYEDMGKVINQIISQFPVTLEKDYRVPDLENAAIYPVDYSLQEQDKTILFLFGVPNADKAHLVTIILQHFLIQALRTPTLLIFEDQEKLPPKHLSRLMDANVGGSQVSSLSAVDAIEQNIARCLH